MANAMIWVLIVIVLLVGIDKAITFANIKAVEKNFPEVDKYSIEKNPLAKFFFKNFGLIGGTIVYFILSVITFLIALKLLDLCLALFRVTNSFSIALWIMIILYCIVIGNNLFFLLKFNGVIP